MGRHWIVDRSRHRRNRRQMEYRVRAAHKRRHRIRVANIRFMKLDLAADFFEIPLVTG